MDWVTALGMGVWGLVSGLFVPDLIRRLPEPEPDRPITDEEEGASSSADEPTKPEDEEPPKELYADMAALRGMRAGSALAGAVIAGLIGARLGWGWGTAVWAFLTPVGIALAVIDWRTRLLPTRIIAPSYVVVLAILSLATLVEGDTGDLIHAGYGWAILGGTYLLFWFFAPGTGYGDVRLSGVLGIALGYLGWGPLLFGAFLGFLIHGVIGVLLIGAGVLRRRQGAPMGPAMLLGALIGVLWGSDVAAWYMS